MGILTYEFYAQALQKQTRIQICGELPRITKRYKVCFLFHGLGGNETDFFKRLDLELLSKKYKIIFVSFNCDRSFYVNTKTKINYYDFVNVEVPQLVSQITGLNLEQTFNIALGVSMGGYGAMLHGQNKMFDAIASVSGSLDLLDRTAAKMIDKDIKNEWLSIWGYEIDQKYDLFSHNYQKPVYLICATNDHLLGANQKMYKHLSNLKCPATYFELSGAHDWYFFKPAIELILKSVIKGEKNVKRIK